MQRPDVIEPANSLLLLAPQEKLTRRTAIGRARIWIVNVDLEEFEEALGPPLPLYVWLRGTHQ
jgi:hypothetical protein